MNVLWIMESNNKRANYKIAINLAKIMKQKHNIFCAVYSGNEYNQCQELRDVFQNVSFIGSIYSEELSDLYDNKKWLANTRHSKIKYALRHPKIAFELCRQKIGKRKSKCIAQLEKICADENIDAMIGIVFPYEIANIISNVKVGARKFIIQLDPYVNNYTLDPKSKKKRVLEERRLLNSIQGLFTTRIIKQEILSTHGVQNKKIVEIEFPEISVANSDNNMNYDYDSIIKKSENAVIFLYAGSLYSDIRNPSYLVNLFEQLPQNYLLVIAGVNTELLKEYDEKIRDRVTYCGLVEQIEVEQMKRDADVLICFNNAIENQLPSKLFECIETGKPFINLCQLKNCPSLPYVEDYENTINVFVDDIKAEKIVDFIETHKNKVINRDEILKKYGKHTYEHVENQIEEVLTNVNI